MTSKPIDLLDELSWRGLLHQCTDEAGLRQHLADSVNHPRKVYIGFDPTAPSLTIGNLVQIMNLAHVRRAGHIPVVVTGGGTGLIGDPSGKSAERTLMTYETVQDHVRAQRPIFDAVLGSVARLAEPGEETSSQARQTRPYLVFNNADWLMKISYLDALRDIGKFFSVNMMMQKDSVKSRLENREQGISYTEFSYMILQAYDFAHLYEKEGVTVQMGGSDQFGNIVAGLDLLRRRAADSFLGSLRRLQQAVDRFQKDEPSHPDIPLWNNLSSNYLRKGIQVASGLMPDLPEWTSSKDSIIQVLSRSPDFLYSAAEDYLTRVIVVWKAYQSAGLTAPLVTKADGGKFGKTESGAIWLTADRTSPYAYYQFWLNASDADAANWIKVFTFLDRPTVESVTARHAENPGARELQRTLAREATTILHGTAAMESAEAAAKALFSGDIAGLDEATLREVLADVPSSERDRAGLPVDGLDLVDVLIDCKLATSKREAREFIASGSVTVNGQKVGESARLTPAHLLHGSLTAIRRGKKNWHLIRWS
jgi:tyrosyl-tRNA synthetase